MVLIESLEIAAPIERCFDLARSVDVHVASSEPLDGSAEAERTSGLSELGDETTWSAKFFGVRFRVTTRIVELDRPNSFREVLIHGLPKKFEHEYTFERLETGATRMTDQFEVESRFWLLGKLVDTLYLRPKMASALAHRAAFIKSVAESPEWKRYLGASP
jgi:hypothetical protein